MAKVVIYKLDYDKDPITTLNSGEHIFGRGGLLKCDDRRVSRAHGKFIVTPQSTTITSIHQNPCFYQSAKSQTITILPKDTPVPVEDGDKFALLADNYWFKIKLQSTTEDCSLSVASLNSYSSISNQSTSNKRERLDEIDPQTLNSKKIKTNIVDQDNNISRNTHNETVTEVAQESTNKYTCKTVETPPINSKKEAKVTSDDPVRAIELRAALFSSDEDDNAESTEIQNSTKHTAEINIVEENATNSVDNIEVKDVDNSNLIKPDDGNRLNDDSTTLENSNAKKDEQTSETKKEPDDTNVAGSSGTQQKKWRERCWYGLNCYRKSALHLGEFSHPGDSDFDSDSQDERPVCAYGASCYRRNTEHRQKYKHPRINKNDDDDDKPNGTQNKNKQKANPKKRTTTKKYYDESSEDDYDLEDPFLADSGSEYEADSGSEVNSSESDWDGSDEEMNRLIKEAKRFMKKKKK